MLNITISLNSFGKKLSPRIETITLNIVKWILNHSTKYFVFDLVVFFFSLNWVGAFNSVNFAKFRMTNTIYIWKDVIPLKNMLKIIDYGNGIVHLKFFERCIKRRKVKIKPENSVFWGRNLDKPPSGVCHCVDLEKLHGIHVSNVRFRQPSQKLCPFKVFSISYAIIMLFPVSHPLKVTSVD